MRIGSLFSGAGGLDLAVLEVFGGKLCWHAEIDKAASKVLAYRFPGVPNLGDITQVDWDDVWRVDVLCGGFPCQDVSAAGKRAGIKQGTRSGLWAVFADAIEALRPRWVVIENVRGLLSATAQRTVEDGDSLESAAGVVGNGAGRPVLRAAGAVLGDLADLGYDAVWATVAASDVGAPHRRERVFIVAHSSIAAVWESAGSASAEETRSQSGDRPGDCGGERTPRDGRQACVCGCRRIDHDWGAHPDRFDDGGCRRCRCESFWPADEPEVALLPTPTTQDGANNGGPSQFQRNTLPLNAEVMLLPTPEAKNSHAGPDYARMNREGSGGHDRVTAVSLLPTPKAHDGEFGTPRTSGRPIDKSTHLGTIASLEHTSHWGKYEPAIRRWEQIVGPAPAPTEPNKNGNPRLSAAFSEWLMGWPAGWVTDPAIGISRNDQLRIIGNGVCPQQAAAALQYLLAIATGTHTHTPERNDMTPTLLPTPTSRDHKGANQRGDTTCLHGAINQATR